MDRCTGLAEAPRLPTQLVTLLARGCRDLLAHLSGPRHVPAHDTVGEDAGVGDDAMESVADEIGIDVHPGLDGDRHFRAYLSIVRRRARLDHDAELREFERLGDANADVRSAARAALVQANLWIVPIIVRRYYRQGSGFEDLVAEGNLGLYRALERFDPTRGLRFSTYAKWWVTHAVTASMAANAYPVRLPRRVAQQIARDRRLDGATPSIEPPLAESYDAETDDRADDASLLQPDVALLLKQGLRLLRCALDELPERERVVIEGRYGLNGQTERTLQDLGAQLGMSAEGVRKIQLAAMERLKRKLASGWQ
jgi:RNA polymerase sigma factor (sigma-70 family)